MSGVDRPATRVGRDDNGTNNEKVLTSSVSLSSLPTSGVDVGGGREKERRIEKAISETLAPISTDEIDLAELRLVLRRFRNVDAALEAHRLAQWAASKGETLTFPLRMLERWLEKARPMATERKPRRGGITEAEISRRSEGRRRLLARCMDWEGNRLDGTLRQVRSFSESEIDAEVAEFEAQLRGKEIA